ncbi:glycoside hydrolase family 78 protein [Annulohypoxylon maeteangense]|uniref:glycoside hydrolase family 78 protein n=1 Tax=Annulohypoxylon maeteangense TaxID=1927788 RepID=UPI002007C210|nr:glycoside hydrolase family 78 protein [Annulohypoxylon maeteangense]KAI0883065.1 glycoside hydrolase family 78 protein [Annulohypoxylon maeteangense]
MAAVTVSQVSFEHHREALGIGEANPRISWRFEGSFPNWTQSGYSLELSRQSEVQLFHYNSSDSILVPWPTVSLSSAESATVRVRAYGEGDQPDTPWSDPFNVETGLLTQEDWSNATIIAADKETEQNAPHQPVLLRKEFSVGGGIQKARLYITAQGIYDAWINGKRVGDHVLAPGWQSYKHRIEYNTHDVTDLILDGDNAFGIQVGEGWYSGRLGYNGGARNIWGDTLGTMALLVITSEDGTSTKIITDKSWSASTGAIITSEIYDGETYDSRLEQQGWSAPNFTPNTTASWIGTKELETPYSQLAAPDGPPIRRVETVELKEILTSPSGKTILDFGQNLVGWLKLTVAGPEGTKIKLTHVEVLENGEIATRPLRNATQTDYLTLSGKGTETWEPTFTYHGFRFVEVDGWPEETPLDGKSITAIVVHSDLEETGTFECSNELLNKLHKNVRWSMKGNFMSIPTDCPQRDERLGWTGDAHAFSPAANFLMETSGFWRAWLKDFHSEQVNGVPPVVIPGVSAAGSAMATAIWGDGIVGIPWNLYRTTGDLVVLKEQLVGAKEWIDQGIKRNDVGLWNRSTFQFGDWLDPKAPADQPGAATTNSSYVADTYLIYVTGLVSKMASELGLVDDESQYAKSVADLTTAFWQAWPKGSINETQTGLVLPLYFDLYNNDDEATTAASRLESIIADNNYLVGTGFAGTHILGSTLTKYNMTDVFYNMILQTTVPSWLFQVDMNATTTWERWDSLEPDGSLNPGEMTSFNHYAVGSVANWMHTTIGGLAPAQPGWKTAEIAPHPGGNLTSAKASYLSPYGLFKTDWSVDDTGFHLSVDVPPNANAEVTLPGSKKVLQLGSGTYEISDPEFRY